MRVDGNCTIEVAQQHALQFWNERISWFKRAKDRALLEQLETINDYISDCPDLGKISRSAFSKTLSVPDTIQLEIDDHQQWIEFTYHSDLFGDNVVTVSIYPSDDSVETDTQSLW